MKRFLIIPNEKKDKDLSLTAKVCGVLLKAGATVLLDERYVHGGTDGVTFLAAGEVPEDVECVITVGGDGTVLDASRMALRLGVPLLGINLGRLGYLSELEPADISRLTDLVKGDYTVRERMTLKVTLLRNQKAWVMPRLSVNDVVFYRSDIGHVVSLSLRQGEGEAITYLGDGLILSTPTGSTAYSLSAGGPILSASLDAICATPICPHSFHNRAIVFDTAKPLLVENTSEDSAISVTMDGRENFLLEPGDAVTIERSSRTLQLISFRERNLLDILNQKMK
ncbi:MAG: NAD(+)/NADH kinase [Clostridia bacterium]|nr:NAD(+)/NADH kinase [Clostridia bacterium]